MANPYDLSVVTTVDDQGTGVGRQQETVTVPQPPEQVFERPPFRGSC